MWKIRNEAKMEAGNHVFDFWICDEITADYEKFNWSTYTMEKVESLTSQKYFVTHLQGAGPADTVNLYINSMGGSVKEALGIYNVLKRCPAQVVAYIDGFAASAASVIAMAADRIIMPRNTAMMVHNAAWAIYGNPEELRKSADDLEVINLAAIQSYMNHAGEKLTAPKLQEMLDAARWLTAEDCMACGLADEYAATDADLDEAVKQFRAEAKAASEHDAKMFKEPPEFMAAALAKPEEPAPAPKAPAPEPKPEEEPKPAPADPEAETHSCIFMLLENMTK